MFDARVKAVIDAALADAQGDKDRALEILARRALQLFEDTSPGYRREALLRTPRPAKDRSEGGEPL